MDVFLVDAMSRDGCRVVSCMLTYASTTQLVQLLAEALHVHPPWGKHAPGLAVARGGADGGKHGAGVHLCRCVARPVPVAAVVGLDRPVEPDPGGPGQVRGWVCVGVFLRVLAAVWYPLCPWCYA